MDRGPTRLLSNFNRLYFCHFRYKASYFSYGPIRFGLTVKMRPWPTLDHEIEGYQNTQGLLNSIQTIATGNYTRCEYGKVI